MEMKCRYNHLERCRLPTINLDNPVEFELLYRGDFTLIRFSFSMGISAPIEKTELYVSKIPEEDNSKSVEALTFFNPNGSNIDEDFSVFRPILDNYFQGEFTYINQLDDMNLEDSVGRKKSSLYCGSDGKEQIFDNLDVSLLIHELYNSYKPGGFEFSLNNAIRKF